MSVMLFFLSNAAYSTKEIVIYDPVPCMYAITHCDIYLGIKYIANPLYMKH